MRQKKWRNQTADHGLRTGTKAIAKTVVAIQ